MANTGEDEVAGEQRSRDFAKELASLSKEKKQAEGASQKAVDAELVAAQAQADADIATAAATVAVAAASTASEEAATRQTAVSDKKRKLQEDIEAEATRRVKLETETRAHAEKVNLEHKQTNATRDYAIKMMEQATKALERADHESQHKLFELRAVQVAKKKAAEGAASMDKLRVLAKQP